MERSHPTGFIDSGSISTVPYERSSISRKLEVPDVSVQRLEERDHVGNADTSSTERARNSIIQRFTEAVDVRIHHR